MDDINALVRELRHLHFPAEYGFIKSDKDDGFEGYQSYWTPGKEYLIRTIKNSSVISITQNEVPANLSSIQGSLHQRFDLDNNEEVFSFLTTIGVL